MMTMIMVMIAEYAYSNNGRTTGSVTPDTPPHLSTCYIYSTKEGKVEVENLSSPKLFVR